MFDPYEIESEGRSYFGNVSLREFHIFDYDGNLYLVDLESMAACPISPPLVAMIDRVASTSGGLIPEPAMIELRRLKLIAGEEEAASPETPPAAGSGESGS